MASSAVRKVVGRISSRMVRKPPIAAACAMLRPIVPAPMTAMVRTSINGLVAPQVLHDLGIVGFDLFHVIGDALLLFGREEAVVRDNTAKSCRDVVDVILHAKNFPVSDAHASSFGKTAPPLFFSPPPILENRPPPPRGPPRTGPRKSRRPAPNNIPPS